MDSEKLMIGGGVIIALVIAIPLLAPMFSHKNEYDPVADSHKLKQLSDAVNAYAQANGQYPPSLYYLAPQFLEELPLTSTNMEFDYDPATGSVTNPSAPVARRPLVEEKATNKRGRYDNRGVSPATDAMTGLGVSQELNY